MTAWVVRRLLQTAIVLVGVTLLSFLTLHLSGDPTYLYVSERASAEEIEKTRRALGFDRPLPEQYLDYLGNLLQGDFGHSLRVRRPAIDLVRERLPATIELTLMAMLVATVFAIPAGILSAMRRGTTLDGGIMLLAMFGQSIPSFWLGLMSIIFFGLVLRVLPISGHIPLLTPLFAGDFSTALENLPRALRHLLLPAFSVGVYSLSRNARLVRSAMLEVISQDYILTARAKGLSAARVVWRHAFRNALIPVVTILGLEFGFLLSGVVVTEMIFSWPGVGRMVFDAIAHRDIPLVQAAVVVFSFLFVLLNLIVDLLYFRLDPRIQLK